MLRRFIAGLFLALLPILGLAQSQVLYVAKTSLYPLIESAPFPTKWDAAEDLRGKIDAHMATLAVQCVAGSQNGELRRDAHWTSYGSDGSPTSFKVWRDTYSSTQNCNKATTEMGSYSVSYTTQNPCTAGTQKDITLFDGWYRTTTSELPETRADTPDPYCDGVCVYTVDADRIESSTTCQAETTPSENGYYRGTCTIPYKQTGAACSVKSPDPSVPPPDAPNPDNPPDPDPGDGGGPGDGDGPGDGEPGDGEPGDGEPGDGGGECVPTENNPCDGGGSGGGSSGEGPGDGEGEGDEKGAECGVPGKPACSVKVDETGTASVDQLIEQVQDMHDYTAQLSGPNGEVQQMNDDLKNMNPGSVFGMNDWSWSFQLPTGCTPLVMADFNVTIDPCQWQSTIHDLMSMIWIISTFFGVLWIARGTF